MAKSDSGEPQARLLIQQCLSASLNIKPGQDSPEYLHIKRGMVVFLCFMKSATPEVIDKLVKTVSEVRLSEQDSGRLGSILQLPGDILVIPQATLGGHLKGKLMQYHNNVDKQLGQQLYSDFVKRLQDAASASSQWKEAGCVLHAGLYGNRQVLNMDTNGPFSHIIDF